MTDYTRDGKPRITHDADEGCPCCTYAWAALDAKQARIALLEAVAEAARVASNSTGGAISQLTFYEWSMLSDAIETLDAATDGEADE